MPFQTRPLGELCDVLDSKRKPITKKDRVPGEFPYYGATGILDHVEDFIFDEKLVLIGEDGAKWGAGENTAFTADGKYWVNNHAHVIRPHRNIVLDEWIIYHLNHNDLSPFITGLTVPKLNQGKLREIPIPLPPLPEQRQIVSTLEEAFGGIEAAVANAEKNLANARELFESYLNAVFTQKGEGWVELSDLATDITDGDHAAPPKSQTGIPFITISNVNKRTNEIDFSDTFKVPEEYFRNLKDKRKPKKGDVLYTVTGSFGIPIIVSGEVDFCFQRHIGLIRPDTDTNSKWLYYLLQSKMISEQAHGGATGTAQKTVSLKVLRRFKVPKMSAHVQNAIVTELDALVAITRRLEAIYQQKLDDLAELKQSILQKAFSGELTQNSNEGAAA